MQDSTKNQATTGNKNLNQQNQKQPIQTPGQGSSDKKLNSDVKTGKDAGNQTSKNNQQDRSSKR
jgi:hypothetical protein